MPSIPPCAVATLVEGESDAIVVRHLLDRSGLTARVVPMDGITNIAHWLDRCDAQRSIERVTGLYDLAEEHFVVRALAQRGLRVDDAGPARHGFFGCDQDLEDELIRAVGPERVVAGLEDIGLGGTFRIFAQQPQWRDRPVASQLRRFAGAGSGRKAVLAEHLVALLTTRTVPAPLAGLIAAVRGADTTAAALPRGEPPLPDCRAGQDAEIT